MYCIGTRAHLALESYAIAPPPAGFFSQRWHLGATGGIRTAGRLGDYLVGSGAASLVKHPRLVHGALPRLLGHVGGSDADVAPDVTSASATPSAAPAQRDQPACDDAHPGGFSRSVIASTGVFLIELCRLVTILIKASSALFGGLAYMVVAAVATSTQKVSIYMYIRQASLASRHQASLAGRARDGMRVLDDHVAASPPPIRGSRPLDPPARPAGAAGYPRWAVRVVDYTYGALQRARVDQALELAFTFISERQSAHASSHGARGVLTHSTLPQLLNAVMTARASINDAQEVLETMRVGSFPHTGARRRIEAAVVHVDREVVRVAREALLELIRVSHAEIDKFYAHHRNRELLAGAAGGFMSRCEIYLSGVDQILAFLRSAKAGFAGDDSEHAWELEARRCGEHRSYLLKVLGEVEGELRSQELARSRHQSQQEVTR